MKTLKDCKVGDTVYVQSEYNLRRGVFLKLNNKSVKVRYEYQDWNNGGQPAYYEVNEKIEKVAHAEEMVAMTWETWKGVNGRGGYRLDKSMYPSYHREAGKWPYQATIEESGYGVLDVTRSDSRMKSAEKNMQNLKDMMPALNELLKK